MIARPLHDERRGLETVWAGDAWRAVPPPPPAPPLPDYAQTTSRARRRAAGQVGRPGRARMRPHLTDEWQSVATLAGRAKLTVQTAARLLFNLTVHGQAERDVRYGSTGRAQSLYRRVGR